MSMTVGHAREVARQRVREEALRIAGLQGAYLAGSTNWLPDDAPLPATSDLDVNLVLTGSDPPKEREKLVCRGVLLEFSYLSIDQVKSPDLVLSHYHLAGGFRRPSVILDPSGNLTDLQAAVARDFARRRWVHMRCAHARNRVLEGLAASNESAPFHDQVIGWVFPAGVTTHVLLVAGLKNPTVRRRYVAVSDLLAEYGHLDLYEGLLEVLGCARMSRVRVERHLAALAEVFDVARAVIRSPFPFASDISTLARPMVIDGSRDLIEQGYHREAIFWMVVTYSRCQKVLDSDAPAAMQRKFEPGYRQLLADLGITSLADLRRRKEQVVELLPRVWRVVEDIMAANPEIEE
jgi:hypothetical protein